MDTIDRGPYRAHRARFLATLAERGAAAVVPTATAKLRNGDSEYAFRPDSDFWYLTGFGEPESVLVLLPASERREVPESVLFLRERHAEQETWTGRRLGVEAAPAALGVERAYPIDELWERLPELLAGERRVVYATGADAERDRLFLHTLDELRHAGRSPLPPFEALLDPAPLLHEQRLVKSAPELERMRRAAAIAGEGHRAVMAAARAGMREYELDALLGFEFRRRGAVGPAYSNIVAAGDNACILHYHQGADALASGQLVLVDAGAEYEHYASDVSRTFPVDGVFSEPQRLLYELVLAAQEAAIACVRPGATVDEVHARAVDVLVRGLCEHGLISGDPQAAREAGEWRRYYMHRTSHWLGLDVHDCGAYSVGGAPRPLVPGMVLTVEPGLYVAADADEVDARWRGIGIRIEDDVLVTEEGCEVLSAGVPRTVAEVEAACRANGDGASGRT